MQIRLYDFREAPNKNIRKHVRITLGVGPMLYVVGPLGCPAMRVLVQPLREETQESTSTVPSGMVSRRVLS